jgi:hypothetical protein
MEPLHSAAPPLLKLSQEWVQQTYMAIRTVIDNIIIATRARYTHARKNITNTHMHTHSHRHRQKQTHTYLNEVKHSHLSIKLVNGWVFLWFMVGGFVVNGWGFCCKGWHLRIKHYANSNVA